MKKTLIEGSVSALVAVAVAFFASGVSCQTTSAPPQGPRTADQVNSMLVDAGCLPPGDAAAVAQELATGHDPWLSCLVEGGTIAGCNVPCGPTSRAPSPSR